VLVSMSATCWAVSFSYAVSGEPATIDSPIAWTAPGDAAYRPTVWSTVADRAREPFGLEELAVRIRTVLRRTRPVPVEPVLTFADLTLDQDTYEVRRGGHRIDLSPTEFRLLRYFMLNPGRVLTRVRLLDHVWDYDFGGSGTVVSTYVAYLRRKLASTGPDLIHTQRAVGYSLRLPRPEEDDEP
jgi:two-component system, OmpR family, response regulator